MSGSPSPRQRARRALLAIGLALWVVLPLACIVVVREQASSTRFRRDRPTFVEVTANTTERSADAGLRLHWASGSPVVAPDWNGVVSDLRLRPGRAARDGAVAVVVDGVGRMLAATEHPFTRPLTMGDRGPDVRDLNRLLHRRHLENSAGDAFGTATWRGVYALSKQLGATPAPVFDPAWVLFLSRPGAMVTTTGVTVGAPAPAAGETVFGLAAELQSAEVIPHQAAPPDTAGAEGPSEPSAGGPEAPTAPTGRGAFDQIPAVPVPRGARLRAGDHVLRLGASRSTVDRRSLSIVAASVAPGAAYADAVTTSDAGGGEVVVPAAAVISDQLGGTCVRAGRGISAHAVRVIVTSGESGQTVVTPARRDALRPGDVVELAPPAEHRSCPSN